jgi:hypothetical protein
VRKIQNFPLATLALSLDRRFGPVFNRFLGTAGEEESAERGGGGGLSLLEGALCPDQQADEVDIDFGGCE